MTQLERVLTRPPVTTSHRDEKMTKLVQNLYVHDFIMSDYHRDLDKNYLRPKYVTKLWGGYFFCYLVPFRADGTGVIFGRYTNLLQSKKRKSCWSQIQAYDLRNYISEYD